MPARTASCKASCAPSAPVAEAYVWSQRPWASSSGARVAASTDRCGLVIHEGDSRIVDIGAVGRQRSLEGVLFGCIRKLAQVDQDLDVALSRERIDLWRDVFGRLGDCLHL